MKSSLRRIGSVLIVLSLLIGFPVWMAYRNMKQQVLGSILLDAIREGDDQRALVALDNGANGETLDNPGAPPTFWEALEHLFDHSLHSGQEDEGAHIPVLLLCDQQRMIYGGPNPDVVEALVNHGAHVNDRDDKGRSPLWYATYYYDPGSARLLIERGADVNQADSDGITPLIHVNTDVTKDLLEHGANIEAVDKDQETPLMWAAKDLNYNKVRLLLEHGAKVGQQDINGMTAIDRIQPAASHKDSSCG